MDQIRCQIRRNINHRKQAVILSVIVILLITCDIVGIYEMIMSRPYSEFKWPLDIKPNILIEDFHSTYPRISKINTNNFSFLLSPHRHCQSYKPFVTVLIKTAAYDKHNRDVIRGTWVKDIKRYNLRYAFLVGLCGYGDDDCQSLLEQEQTTHNDLLQQDFIDSYQNNTYKMTMGLRYMTEMCDSGSNFTFFIDGDYALNIVNLLTYLHNLRSHENFYGGKMWFTRPLRQKFDKHYRSLEQYPYAYYPPFIAAGALLLSEDVVKRFYILSHYTKYFPFDDVFFGFIAKKLDVTAVQMSDLLPSYFNIPQKDDIRNLHLIGSHRFGHLDEVEFIYNKLPYLQEIN